MEGDEPYHGHEGIRRWWASVDASMEHVDLTAADVRDLGDTLLALGHLRARFRSGVTLDTEVGWVLHYRGALTISGRGYSSHAEALEAAGIAG